MPDDGADTPLFRLEAVLASGQPFRGERSRLVPVALQTVVAVILGLLILSAGLIAALETTQRVIVTGELLPVDGEVSVPVPRSGVLEQLYASEGQRVARHTRLARVETATDWREGRRLSKVVNASLDARRQEIDAQRNRLTTAIEQTRSDAQDRLAQLLGQRELAAELVDVQHRRHQYASERFSRVGVIEQRGYLSAYAYGELRDGVLAREQAETESRLALQRIDELRNRVRQTERIRSAELEGQLSALQLHQSELESQQAQETARWSYEIVAPRAGTIAGLEEVAGDGLVAGQTLLKIVTHDAQLKARLYIPTDAAAGLRQGLPVDLRIDAFPHQKFGTVTGTVDFVSSTALIPDHARDQRQLGVPVYLLDVSLESQVLQHGADERTLRPGMSVTAEIELDRRRLGRRVLDALTGLT